MRAVIQRVSTAAVTTDTHSASIDAGLLVLVGVEQGDGPDDVAYIVRKIRELRLFRNGELEFDRSVEDVNGSVMVVSQFTLTADCRKGRRPSLDAAATPDVARPLYESVVLALREAGLLVAPGVFQADMKVALVNDGPVTVLLDSRRRF